MDKELRKIALKVAQGRMKEEQKIIVRKKDIPNFFVAGEKVLAFDGTWMYYASILDVKSIQKKNIRFIGYRIHYTGWSGDYDVTLPQDYLMRISTEAAAIKSKVESIDGSFQNEIRSDTSSILPAKFRIREKVMAYSAGRFYDAQVIDIKDNAPFNTKYKIHFTRWSKAKDQWIDIKRIFKLTPISREIQDKLLYSGKKGDKRYPENSIDKMTKIKERNRNQENGTLPCSLGETRDAFIVSEDAYFRNGFVGETASVRSENDISSLATPKASSLMNEIDINNNDLGSGECKTNDTENAKRAAFEVWMKKWFPSWNTTESV